jgi:hypothetical protein
MDCLRSTCYTPAIGNIGCERLLANAVRITLLTAIGTSVSAGVAVGGFHSQAGWLFVLAVDHAHGPRRRGIGLPRRPDPHAGVTRPRDAHMTTSALIAGYIL